MSSPAPGLGWIPLGQLLVDGRILTEEQLRRVLEEKASTGQRLGEIAVSLGFTTERAIAGALAEQYELEYVDLDVAQLDRQAVALLPEELARRYEALPLRILEDGTLLLAVTDPTNLAIADDLRFALGASFRIAVAERGQIDARNRAGVSPLAAADHRGGRRRVRRGAHAATTSAPSPRARPRSPSSTRC